MTYAVCAEGSCGDADFYDVMESRLIQMTFWAHKEVLYEKIKQKIEAEEGEKLEKIAELLIEASKSRMQSSKEFSKKQDALREKLREHFE